MHNPQKIFILLFSLICCQLYGKTGSKIDSLLIKIKEEKRDSQRISALLEIAYLYNNTGFAKEEVLQYAEEALNLSLKNKYYNWEVSAYINEAYYYKLKNDNEKALEAFLKALDICEKEDLSRMHNIVCNDLSNFYLTSIKNDKKALEYSLRSLDMAKKFNDKKGMAVSYGNTGTIYYNMNNFRGALKYYSAALNMLDSLNDKDNAATMNNNIGSVYTQLNVFDTALVYYRESLARYKELKDNDGIATTMGNIGNIYNMKGDMEDGIKYTEQALTLAREVSDKDMVASAYTFLAEGYSKKGNYQKAYEYQSALSNLKDTIFNEANTKQVNDMQVKYDTEKKDRENKILELNINRQKIISYSILAGLVLVMALVFFVFRSYINKKRAHEELAEKNKIIEEKNKDILDSINYAKTIQHAILTPEEYLKEALGEYFIVYKPRDVVSGDFYWCHINENKVIFTVADCTGHGVPGALMSMIGNSLLNEVVIENKVTDAAEILNNLRKGLLKTLQQKGQNNITRDGMDISLCVWDKHKNTMQFAGANNPLYLVRDNINGSIQANGQLKIHDDRLAEFLPDKQPIGYYETKTETPFGLHTIQLQKGDIIYISTDGFADQFGGEAVKKYTKKKFRELLSMLSVKQLAEHKNTMDLTFETWKGNNSQTDDVCIMGVKVS